MKTFIALFSLMMVCSHFISGQIPDAYKNVDQVIWVVSDLDKTIDSYKELGFEQISRPELARLEAKSLPEAIVVRFARANLGGARINWIQPLEGNSLFKEFLQEHGEGALGLVHKMPDSASLHRETVRLDKLGISILDEVVIFTSQGSLPFVLMDTENQGKYVLAFTYGDDYEERKSSSESNNRHGMKLSQYAFAVRDAEPASSFWQRVGLPEFQINHPVLGETRYYGKLVDHQLIQGWQRHGTIPYEWCIPVKPPIVYEDHIRKHGEGIHHLAFNVDDMDAVLKDFTSRGYVVSMGGTWGEKDRPGSGRYEYIDLDKAGGLTMELLWSYTEK